MAKRTAGGFYAVARGRSTGIFHSWSECEAQVKGFPGARYKKFPSQSEAEYFVKTAGGAALVGGAVVRHGERTSEPTRYFSANSTTSSSASTSAPLNGEFSGSGPVCLYDNSAPAPPSPPGSPSQTSPTDPIQTPGKPERCIGCGSRKECGRHGTYKGREVLRIPSSGEAVATYVLSPRKPDQMSIDSQESDTSIESVVSAAKSTSSSSDGHAGDSNESLPVDSEQRDLVPGAIFGEADEIIAVNDARPAEMPKAKRKRDEEEDGGATTPFTVASASSSSSSIEKAAPKPQQYKAVRPTTQLIDDDDDAFNDRPGQQPTPGDDYDDEEETNEGPSKRLKTGRKERKPRAPRAPRAPRRDGGKRRMSSLAGPSTSLPGSSGSGDVVDVWCDGSALGNGKHGARAGWGVYFGAPGSSSRFAHLNQGDRLEGPVQTNNRGELQAILRACELTPPSVALRIHTDSRYSIDCIVTWQWGWRKRGWKLSTGGDVQNRDLIEQIEEAFKKKTTRPILVYVPGHSGDVGNDAADRLAKAGAARSAPRSYSN